MVNLAGKYDVEIHLQSPTYKIKAVLGILPIVVAVASAGPDDSPVGRLNMPIPLTIFSTENDFSQRFLSGR